jgi:hypothetical protein
VTIFESTVIAPPSRTIPKRTVERSLAHDRMLEGDRLLIVRFGQQARRFNHAILNDRLHFWQYQHALAGLVKRARRLAFPCPALIVQHPPPLSMIEGAEGIAGPQQARAAFRAVIPKQLVHQTLIHGHFGTKTTGTLVRSGTGTLVHNPIVRIL